MILETSYNQTVDIQIQGGDSCCGSKDNVASQMSGSVVGMKCTCIIETIVF